MAKVSADHLKRLREQVEAIRDTEPSDFHEIIVKAGTENDAEDAFSRSIATTLRKRSMSTSARDVLPSKRVDEAAVVRSSQRKGVASSSRFVAAAQAVNDLSLSGSADRLPKGSGDGEELAGKSMGAIISLLRQTSMAALQQVTSALQEAMPQRATAAAATASKRAGAGRKGVAFRPREFWSSGSILLRVAGKDLANLYSDALAEKIEAVFPNRRVTLPPAVAPNRIPHWIEDNKVSGWGVRSIGALGVWGAFNARGAGVRIALLDTGIDPTHPDLAGKIDAWEEFDERGDPVPGSKPYDSDRHGTHCAGIMVGGNANGRWIGVAPEARIAAALVLNGERGGTHAQILAGMEWAINQKVDVINMSLGGLMWGPDVPSTYTSAIMNALRVGIPVVTAIGNEGSQTSGSPGNDILAFAVGATDFLNRAAGFSGGRTQVIRQSPFFSKDLLPLVYSKPDISAPGVAIESSVPGGKWEHFNGTSMAAPHVAGAIALLLSATAIRDRVDPAERALLLQDLLTGSAEELGEAGQNHRFGFGRVDILRAVGFARDLGY
ncbi:S8 family serine peptidase [Prosthecodimorpha staleyi]|uniref:S8 family serine peptidase n=1 Tax=Prosthecodimorpha staleyi TaxID=2840188 RepID=A0A947D0P3_9HYPH|nr:S8 family serine peptidase [Prosthecodimorpha staleyi]MBT9288083.1 S8 family serine peptidase [Prosthecodimorpha staleyi]